MYNMNHFSSLFVLEGDIFSRCLERTELWCQDSRRMMYCIHSNNNNTRHYKIAPLLHLILTS